MAFSNVSLSFPPSIEQKRYIHEHVKWLQRAVAAGGFSYAAYQAWQGEYWTAGMVGLASFVAHDVVYLIEKSIFNIVPDDPLTALRKLISRDIEIVIDQNSSQSLQVEKLHSFLLVQWETNDLPISMLKWVLNHAYSDAAKVELTIASEVKMTQTLLNNSVETFTFFSKND